MKHRRCERHSLFWIMCRISHLPSLLSRTEQQYIHTDISSITMDILEQKRDLVNAMKKGMKKKFAHCLRPSLRERGSAASRLRLAWQSLAVAMPAPRAPCHDGPRHRFP